MAMAMIRIVILTILFVCLTFLVVPAGAVQLISSIWRFFVFLWTDWYFMQKLKPSSSILDLKRLQKMLKDTFQS